MKNMSFSRTIMQMHAQTKTVTRRLNWWRDKNFRPLLKAGQLIQPVEQCMGLKKGQRIVWIGCPIEIIRITREYLWQLLEYPNGGEIKREGFPGVDGETFLNLFCRWNHCHTATEVTRVEFKFIVPKDCDMRSYRKKYPRL